MVSTKAETACILVCMRRLIATHALQLQKLFNEACEQQVMSCAGPTMLQQDTQLLQKRGCRLSWTCVVKELAAIWYLPPPDCFSCCGALDMEHCLHAGGQWPQYVLMMSLCPSLALPIAICHFTLSHSSAMLALSGCRYLSSSLCCLTARGRSRFSALAHAIQAWAPKKLLNRRSASEAILERAPGNLQTPCYGSAMPTLSLCVSDGLPAASSQQHPEHCHASAWNTHSSTMRGPPHKGINP